MIDNKIELKRFIFECIAEYLELHTFDNYGNCRSCQLHKNDDTRKWVNIDSLCKSCEER